MNSEKETIVREIRHSVWEGKIPIKLNFSSADMGNLPKSPPQLTFDEYYCLLPRCSYLSFYLKDFIEFLFREVIEDPDFSWAEIWLDFNGLPLKWHYPIGLLYDLFVESTVCQDTSNYPWLITLRYGNYPADRLFRFFQPRQLEPLPSSDFFMALNKESNYIRHGNAKKIMNLSKDDQNQLWESLVTNKFDSFWDIQGRLNDYSLDLGTPKCTDGLVSHEKLESMFNLPKHVPTRVHVTDEALFNSAWDSKDLGYPYFLQELISPLIHISPPTENSNDSNVSPTVATLASVLDSMEAISFTSDLDVIIHGITFPHNTPLIWAYLHFMHPDGFLHIVLKPSPKS